MSGSRRGRRHHAAAADWEAAGAAGSVGNHATETRYSKQLAEMDPYFHDENSEDLSYSDLDSFPVFLVERSTEILSLHLDHNLMSVLPAEIGAFVNLISLDVSNNRMSKLSDDICRLPQLRTLVARNNCLENDSIPKDFGLMPNLMVLNLSGNSLTEVPMQFTELPELKCLYLGANRISSVPREIGNLQR